MLSPVEVSSVSSELVVSSTDNFSISMCSVVLCSRFSRMVVASAGGGVGGSGGIATLVFLPSTNYSSNVLGSTPGILSSGVSFNTVGVFFLLL